VFSRRRYLRTIHSPTYFSRATTRRRRRLTLTSTSSRARKPPTTPPPLTRLSPAARQPITRSCSAPRLTTMRRPLHRTTRGEIQVNIKQTAGSRLWNSLPADVRSASSLTTFRQNLKFHLFRQYYPVASPAKRHWGTCPLSTFNDFILVHFGVNLRANYPRIV